MTTEAKKNEFEGHTPGPWHHDDDPWVLGHDNGFIASVFDGTRKSPTDHGISLANARLIAAAPDLLRERDSLRTQLDGLLPHVQSLVKQFVIKAGPDVERNQYGHLELWCASDVTKEPDALRNPFTLIGNATNSYQLGCMGLLAGHLEQLSVAVAQPAEAAGLNPDQVSVQIGPATPLPEIASLRAQIETMIAIAAVRERRLATAIVQRDELLRVLGDECDCPRPANAAPPGRLSVRECMNRKECGCCFGSAIISIESQKGGEG